MWHELSPYSASITPSLFVSVPAWFMRRLWPSSWIHDRDGSLNRSHDLQYVGELQPRYARPAHPEHDVPPALCGSRKNLAQRHSTPTHVSTSLCYDCENEYAVLLTCT
jgi:hypothetical protein